MSFKSFYPKFVNKCGFLSLQLKDLNFSIKYLLFFEKLLIQILWRFRTIEAFPKFYFYVPENFDYQCKNIPMRVLLLDQKEKMLKIFLININVALIKP